MTAFCKDITPPNSQDRWIHSQRREVRHERERHVMIYPQHTLQQLQQIHEERLCLGEILSLHQRGQIDGVGEQVGGGGSHARAVWELHFDGRQEHIVGSSC
jgi:1-aminocyclopropane-1-carboxylate deaminase/D-cysteine desulfhydrase-like pyridoxal-dependent ACC family enzyme